MLEKLPKELRERLTVIYTKEEIEVLSAWFSLEKRKTTFRINRLLSNTDEVEAALEKASLQYTLLPFPSDCYILENGVEKDLWNLDIYKAWKIYVQWISSQIPPYFLDIQEGDVVLDATAAPGGKTAILSYLVWKEWKVVAVELWKIRYEKMQYNLTKLGAKNVESVHDNVINYSKNIVPLSFDHILFDAPCSAEWTINLNSDKIWNTWNTGNIKKNYKGQAEIINSLVWLLKVWWTLVYSTCTLAPEENEWLVHYVLCNHKNFTLEDIEIPLQNTKKWIPHFWKYIYKKEITKSIRIIPNTQTEGFFIAKFRKTWL